MKTLSSSLVLFLRTINKVFYGEHCVIRYGLKGFCEPIDGAHVGNTKLFCILSQFEGRVKQLGAVYRGHNVYCSLPELTRLKPPQSKSEIWSNFFERLLRRVRVTMRAKGNNYASKLLNFSLKCYCVSAGLVYLNRESLLLRSYPVPLLDEKGRRKCRGRKEGLCPSGRLICYIPADAERLNRYCIGEGNPKKNATDHQNNVPPLHSSSHWVPSIHENTILIHPCGTKGYS